MHTGQHFNMFRCIYSAMLKIMVINIMIMTIIIIILLLSSAQHMLHWLWMWWWWWVAYRGRVLMALIVKHKLYLAHYVSIIIIILFNKGLRQRIRY